MNKFLFYAIDNQVSTTVLNPYQTPTTFTQGVKHIRPSFRLPFVICPEMMTKGMNGKYVREKLCFRRQAGSKARGAREARICRLEH